MRRLLLQRALCMLLTFDYNVYFYYYCLCDKIKLMLLDTIVDMIIE